MKILSITVDGFKNIDKTKIEFNTINALVSLNNYGKSNLLEAIGFGVDFIKANPKKKEWLMQNVNFIPLNIHNSGQDYFFEIEILENEHIIRYDFSFEWQKPDGKGRRIISENLKMKKIGDKKFVSYIKRNEQQGFYKPSLTARCNKTISFDYNILIINKLIYYDELFFVNVIKMINELNIKLFKAFDVNKFFIPGKIVNILDNTEEIIEMLNIPQYLFNLKKSDKVKYELFIHALKILFPELEYIYPIEINLQIGTNKDKFKVKFPEKIYDIRIKTKNNIQETSITNLSEGTKRIFFTLFNIMIAPENNVHLLCFEELENSIHPGLLQYFLIILADIAKDTQLLFTSHSPYLIQYLSLNQIYIGLPNEKGLAVFKKIKKSKQNKLMKYAQDSYMSVGEFIFDLLANNEEEKEILKEFF